MFQNQLINDAKLKNHVFRPGVVAHAFDPSTLEAEAGGPEFEASLVYTGSFYTENLHLKRTNT